MSSYEEDLHATLVQLLIDTGERELAAAMIDGAVSFLRDNDGTPCGLTLEIPTSAYDLIAGNPALKQSLTKAARTISLGRFDDDFGAAKTDPPIRFSVKMVQANADWQKVARDLIVNWSGNNQAMVSRKLFQRERRDMLTYNELSYASKSEIRIAQELEARQVLFFPLAVAVRAETGEHYKDHREVDFLVCDEGAWGILEVSYHPGRFEKDAEKDAWFKHSGVLCVQHYTAERCYKEAAGVVEHFLSVLAKHRR